MQTGDLRLQIDLWHFQILNPSICLLKLNCFIFGERISKNEFKINISVPSVNTGAILIKL